jgi:KDO2-lipid IV(A) lauroyltransferase
VAASAGQNAGGKANDEDTHHRLGAHVVCSSQVFFMPDLIPDAVRQRARDNLPCHTRDLMRDIVVRLALQVAGMLPLALAQNVGTVVGTLIWITGSRMARTANENIALAFGPLGQPARRQLVRRCLIETGKTMLETPAAWTNDPGACRARIVDVRGEAPVRSLAAQGNGLIFVIPHVGNWEMLNHYLGHHYGLMHMYRPNPDPRLDRLIQHYREKSGTRFTPTTAGGIRAQLRTLRAGGNIGAMPDQEPGTHTGTFAPFFDVNALTSLLIPQLAQRTGAAVVVATCERLDRGAGFRVVFRPVSIFPSSGADDLKQGAPDTIADIMHAAATRMNDCIKVAVEAIPEQYLWSYKRFRTRPPGEPELYLPGTTALHAALASGLMRGLSQFLARTPVGVQRGPARLTGALVGHHRRKRHVATINVRHCLPDLRPDQQERTVTRSLESLARSGLELPSVWSSPDERFERLIRGIRGDEVLKDPNLGCLILTPPLGNREVVMRWLGSRHRVSEYYHPHPNAGIDRAVRWARVRMGIRLLPHSGAATDLLGDRLAGGEVVLLCPDQQPRRRTGRFVPFFGVPALTSHAITELTRRAAHVAFACALPVDGGFDVEVTPVVFDEASPNDVLHTINHALEALIREHLHLYRWSDKRFNIRPLGEPRFYR